MTTANINVKKGTNHLSLSISSEKSLVMFNSSHISVYDNPDTPVRISLPLNIDTSLYTSNTIVASGTFVKASGFEPDTVYETYNIVDIQIYDDGFVPRYLATDGNIVECANADPIYGSWADIYGLCFNYIGVNP